MRVLVTGATGFLGFHILRKLVAKGHQVTAFHRNASNTARIATLGVREVTGELADVDALRRTVAGHDSVIHAAAHLKYWSRDAGLHQAVNVAGTANVAHACRLEAVNRMLYVSSVAAIGIPEDPRHPADENFPFNLERSGLSYHISKKRGEEMVLQEVAKGLNAVIVNPSSIFGPNGSGYRGAEMIHKVAASKLVPYFKGGICAVHVDDVVDGMLAALDRGECGSRYILGGENISFREIASRALDALGLHRTMVPVPSLVTGALAILMAPVGRIRNQMPRFTPAIHYSSNRFNYYTSAKAQTALGYSPRGFDAIIEECLAWGKHRP